MGLALNTLFTFCSGLPFCRPHPPTKRHHLILTILSSQHLLRSRESWYLNDWKQQFFLYLVWTLSQVFCHHPQKLWNSSFISSSSWKTSWDGKLYSGSYVPKTNNLSRCLPLTLWMNGQATMGVAENQLPLIRVIFPMRRLSLSLCWWF